MAAEFLIARDVTVRLSGRTVLNGLTVTARRSELVALIGPNGAGKTTLLRAIAGLLDYGGQILVGGDDLRSLPMRERGQRISYLPQDRTVHWPMQVFDIIALGRLPHRTAISRLDDNDMAAIEEAQRAANLEDLRERHVDTLSAGELARVLVARALAVKAPLLLADEPVAALDPYHQIEVMELLQAEAQRGAAVIAVLHDLRLAAQFANRVALLHRGQITEFGPPDMVLTPERLAQVYRIRRSEAEPKVPLLGPDWVKI